MGSEGVIPVFVISRHFSRLANVARLVASCGAKQQKKRKPQISKRDRVIASQTLVFLGGEFTEFLSHKTSPSLTVCLQIPGQVVASLHAAAQIPTNDFFPFKEGRGVFIQREAFWIQKQQSESPKGLNEGLTLYWLLSSIGAQTIILFSYILSLLPRGPQSDCM